MIADLKAVGVEEVRTVGGTAQVAELDLGDDLAGVDIEGKGHLEQLVVLVPVHGGGKLNPPAAAPQADNLAEAGGVQLTGEAQAGSQRTRLQHLQGDRLVDGERLLLGHAGNVPGVPEIGYVFKQAELVAGARHKLAPAGLCLLY